MLNSRTDVHARYGNFFIVYHTATEWISVSLKIIYTTS